MTRYLTPSRRLSGALLCASLLAAGCTQATETDRVAEPQLGVPVVGARPALTLQAAGEAKDDATVEVYFTRAPDIEGPRMLELWLEYSDNLTFVGGTPGEALERADKKLVVQAKTAQRVRVLAFASDNLDTVDSGPVVRLAFERKDTEPAQVALLDEGPLVAPRAAGAGLQLGEALRL